MDNVKKRYINILLNELKENRWFDICIVNKLLDSENIEYYKTDWYNTLRLLHTLDFDKLPATFKDDLCSFVWYIIENKEIIEKDSLLDGTNKIHDLFIQYLGD